MPKKVNTREILNSDMFKIFITSLSNFSFLISNFFVSVLIMRFVEVNWFSMPYFNYIVFIFISILLTFILYKTDYIIYLLSLKKEGQVKIIESFKKFNYKTFIKSFNSFTKGIILIFRVTTYNIFNDLFIITLIWTSIIAVFYSFGLIIITEKNLVNLGAMLSAVGILSGIFQFYIQNYKKNVTEKIISDIQKYLLRFLQKANAVELKKFIEVNNKDLFKRLKWDKDDQTNPLQTLLKQHIANRSGKQVKIYNLTMPSNNDASALWGAEHDTINKEELFNQYEKFFKKLKDEYKKDIRNKELINIKSNLYPNIIFFNEIMASIDTDMSGFEKRKELITFDDYKQNYAIDIVSDFMNRLMDI